MAEEAPPPSYTEATTTSPSNNPYLRHRAPPTSTQSTTLTYTLSLSSLSSTPLPSTWQARDVTSTDWAAFLSQLAAHTTPTTTDRKADDTSERAEGLVAEWNAEFFAPRGCKVVLAGASGDGQEPAAGSSRVEEKHEGFGFKVGNSFVGLSVGKNTSGVGLKLPGILLGVATDPSAKDDKSPTGSK